MAVMRLTRTGRNAVVGALAVLLIFVFVGVQVNHEKPEKKTASPARWTTALAETPNGCASQAADGDSVTVDPTDASTSTAMGPNELAAGLVRLAKGVKQWRQRAVVNHTEPEATIVAQVKRFSTDAMTHARLAAARFSLDVQMEALEATRAGPGARAPPPQLPPRQEADTTYPEPSTFACRMLPDGFEVGCAGGRQRSLPTHALDPSCQICEYENVCLDIPSPALGEGQGYASQVHRLSHRQLRALASYVSESSPPTDRRSLLRRLRPRPVVLEEGPGMAAPPHRRRERGAGALPAAPRRSGHARVVAGHRRRRATRMPALAEALAAPLPARRKLHPARHGAAL